MTLQPSRIKLVVLRTLYLLLQGTEVSSAESLTPGDPQPRRPGRLVESPRHHLVSRHRSPPKGVGFYSTQTLHQTVVTVAVHRPFGEISHIEEMRRMMPKGFLIYDAPRPRNIPEDQEDPTHQ